MSNIAQTKCKNCRCSPTFIPSYCFCSCHEKKEAGQEDVTEMSKEKITKRNPHNHKLYWIGVNPYVLPHPEEIYYCRECKEYWKRWNKGKSWSELL